MYTYRYSHCIICTHTDIHTVLYVHILIFTLYYMYTYRYSHCTICTHTDIHTALYVHIQIFTLNEEAFINHFPKCSRTVCANNAPHSDHYVIRFITHPLHPPSHQLNNHLAVSIYLPASVSQLLPDFEFPPI